MKSIFSHYPKVRKPLSEAYSKIYEKEYSLNRAGGGWANKIAIGLEQWMHCMAARPTSADGRREVLEIGAGPLNHIAQENGYSRYDIVEPESFFLDKNPRLPLVNDVYRSISEIPKHMRYDKILSVAVLEHMLDLPREVAMSGALLKSAGSFLAGVPSEGGLLWKLAYTYGTGLPFKYRTGLDYETLMRYEHVNTVDEIEACVRYFFADVKLKRFPFSYKHASLYTFLEAREPFADRCQIFLENRNVLC